MTPTPYDAVVLAGGRSRRMAVGDKTRLTVGGVTLLDRVLDACAGASSCVVVGEERPTALPVRWTREMPAGGGPVAALAAGVREVTAPVVVLLAADLALVDAATVDLLVAAVGGAVSEDAALDGAVLVDDEGREQWLCSAWRSDALRTAALPASGSMRGALGGLRFARVRPGGSAPAAWLDCDTPDDVRRAEELLP